MVTDRLSRHGRAVALSHPRGWLARALGWLAVGGGGFAAPLLAMCVAVAPPAAAEQVQLGYSNLFVDLPWVRRAESEIGSGPTGKGISRSILASFWSDAAGRLLVIMAIIPQPYTYFSGQEPPLAEDIANWQFFDDKTISEQRGVACAFGKCLAFRADDLGCGVFRRQIGTAGKARIESHTESAGPRIYGFYCNFVSPSLDTVELDGVLRGINAED